MIHLSVLDAAKAELYMAFVNSGIRKADMARRLGIPKTTIDSLFDLDRHTPIDQIEAAFAALGKQLSVEIREAA